MQAQFTWSGALACRASHAPIASINLCCMTEIAALNAGAAKPHNEAGHGGPSYYHVCKTRAPAAAALMLLLLSDVLLKALEPIHTRHL